MIANASNLVTLVQAVDRLPLADPVPQGRGHPKVYSERLILKAVVVMIVKRLPTPQLLVAVLNEPTAALAELRMLLSEHGRFPCRRTWERRLARIPDTLPAQIAWFGAYLAALIEPWQEGSPIAAIDSTVIRAQGGVWQKKDRDANIVPHSSIDTEAHWTNQAGTAGSMAGNCI